MGLRESLNQHPRSTGGVAAGLIIAVVALCLYEVLTSGAPTFSVGTSGYFSDDDGATYFSDSLSLIPPFEHLGKQAVTAYVYSCKGGKPFIGYLQRFTAEGIKSVPQSHPPGYVDTNLMEVSLPNKGEKGWVKMTSRAASSITAVKCPEAGVDDLQLLSP